MVIAIQTFGDYLNFHPHLHILITDGAFVGERAFHALHRGDWEQVAELLRVRVLKFFAKKRKLTAQEAEKTRGREGMDFFNALLKMTYLPQTGEVVYRSKRNNAT